VYCDDVGPFHSTDPILRPAASAITVRTRHHHHRASKADGQLPDVYEAPSQIFVPKAVTANSIIQVARTFDDDEG
jgi:hypothetical protein